MYNLQVCTHFKAYYLIGACLNDKRWDGYLASIKSHFLTQKEDEAVTESAPNATATADNSNGGKASRRATFAGFPSEKAAVEPSDSNPTSVI